MLSTFACLLQEEKTADVPPQSIHSDVLQHSLDEIMAVSSCDAATLTRMVQLWVEAVEAAAATTAPEEAPVAADIVAAKKEADRVKQRQGGLHASLLPAHDAEERARADKAQLAFRVAKSAVLARHQAELLQWQSVRPSQQPCMNMRSACGWYHCGT